jgi:F5/8 type C domain
MVGGRMRAPTHESRRRALLALPLCLSAVLGGCGGQRAAPAPAPPSTGVTTIRVPIAPGSALGSFAPNLALGAGIDRLPRDATDTLYSAASLERILSAGWGAVTYRSNTELHVEAWHWNPRGSWSDPSGKGYFTGSSQPSETIRHSLGYPLPRRGFTHNEGTEAHGFSRMTDGDASSFWKSNPYLDRKFTLEDDAAYPQWVVVDLGKHTPIDALRIDWGAPYARRYRLQYWTGEDAIKKPSQGQWHDCPVRGESGEVTQGAGGTTTIRLAPSPIDVQFVRILLEESSETCEGGKAHDPRDCVGYAIREIYLGTLGAAGELADVTHHSPDQSQTVTDCSSVDPWHEPANARDQEGDQSGLDLFFTSGVTRGLPAMIPVAVLYGTPEDSAAEIEYVETRGYPISYVELGEEADGQYMTPEHYAALYLQWAAALHRVDPKLKLGGPAFASSNEDIQAWPDAQGKTSWFGRFLDYLRAHGRLSDLAFMSFEHYPYEPCKYTWDGLYDEPHLIRHIMQAWKDDGLPAGVPIFVTEVNLAWLANGPSMDTFGALWLADYVGAFLSAGGAGTFYFNYLPEPIWRACDDTAGGYTMFTTDKNYRIRQPTSQYFASRLVSQEWVQPGGGAHSLYPASSDLTDAKGRLVVTAYAVHRPDEQWSLLLVNKDQAEPHAVQIEFDDADTKRRQYFAGPVTVTSFGADNYTWHPNGDDGTADPDGPAVVSRQRGGADARYVLPRASVSVVRGMVNAP